MTPAKFIDKLAKLKPVNLRAVPIRDKNAGIDYWNELDNISKQNLHSFENNIQATPVEHKGQ